MRAAHLARVLSGFAVACAGFATPLAAQVRPPILQEAGSRWVPSIGVRAGWDYRNSVPSIGALVRFPVPIPSLPLALTAGGDLVFYDRLTERQGTVDITYQMRGGLYLGGGTTALNSIYPDESERETKWGSTFLAGFRGQAGPLDMHLEFRWIRIDVLRPRFMMLALTYTPGAPRRAGRWDHSAPTTRTRTPSGSVTSSTSPGSLAPTAVGKRTSQPISPRAPGGWGTRTRAPQTFIPR